MPRKQIDPARLALAKVIPPSASYNVDLDWQAYFKEFDLAHGSEPVELEKEHRLLWRDGWTYSNSDYAGPEWPPGEDVERMIRLYWSLRRERAKVELMTVGHLAEEMRLLQLSRPTATLQHRMLVWDDNGLPHQQTVPLDLEWLKGRMDELEADLAECEGMLNPVEVSDGRQSDEAVDSREQVQVD